LWAHNVFHAVKRVQNPNRDLYTYHIVPCPTSDRVMAAINAADELTITAARVKPVGHGSKAINHVYH
jgi:hypothetical protein